MFVPMEIIYKRYPLRVYNCRYMEMWILQFTLWYCVQSNFRMTNWNVASVSTNQKHPDINISVSFSLRKQWNRWTILLNIPSTLGLNKSYFDFKWKSVDHKHLIFHGLALVQKPPAPPQNYIQMSKCSSRTKWASPASVPIPS